MAPLRPRNRPSTPAKHPFDLPEGLQRQLARAKANMEAPFKGITTDGHARAGLYPLRKTGMSVQPIIDAADTFLAALTPSERATASFDVDSVEWRNWSNIHPYLCRHGVCLDDLNDHQKHAALTLVRASLSAAGYATARDVMKLNEHIREITGRDAEYSEWYYWMSIFGTPSAMAPWGWQIDGHHLIINCFVLGDQLVMTPTFMGSEPVIAEFGRYAGTRVFHEEEAKGFALMYALTTTQQQKARIGMDLPGDVFTSSFRDNAEIKPEGISYGELSPNQQRLLVSLVETYVGRIRPGHAEIRLEEVKEHLPDTAFAWIGPCDEASPFYYRIDSPVLLIEFDHQSGIALDNDAPSRQHIHTVVRTPNGNDYGKDLLRQHYENFDHAHPHASHRLGIR
ncbi:MAG TPA: DUF3500 domain-containing protein [Candidatus Tectomicrobia bacterium]|nr:DUF3500 domain-containing protein [Candidatus Tectomicrobia bacterium]